jgi:N utilization substance protein A
MDTSSIPGLELIQIADVVAREKAIDREEVILAM